MVHGEQIRGVKEVETQAHQFAAEFLPVSHKDRVRERRQGIEPFPLGQPEQPTKLLDYLASPDSATARAVLPPEILEGKARQGPDEGKRSSPAASAEQQDARPERDDRHDMKISRAKLRKMPQLSQRLPQ